MLRWQDIKVDDKAAWQNIKQLWVSGNYSAAITALQNSALQNKWNDASHINELLDSIDDVWQTISDSQFKADAPFTSETAPAAPSTNSIWFQLV